MRRIIAAMVIAAMGLDCFGAPVTVEVVPSADALVRSMEPDLNYGGGGSLAVSGSAAVNGIGDQMGLLDSLLRFELSDAVAALDAQLGSGRWTIVEVTLSLTEDGTPTNPIFNSGVGQFEVRWIAADAWIEGTGKPKNPATDGVTWNDLPGLLDPGVDVSLGVFSNTLESGELTFDLAPAEPFISDITAGGDMCLFLTAVTDSIGFKCDSREEDFPPRLEITAVIMPVVEDLQIVADGPAAATVSWSTTDAESSPLNTYGAVKYRPVAGGEWTTIEETDQHTSHSLQMTGLEPETNYAVVVVNDGIAEEPVYYPEPWPIPGDVTLDCQVNILDMIAIRNHLNEPVVSGDNDRYDVTGDNQINILDMILVRNNLNTTCE